MRCPAWRHVQVVLAYARKGQNKNDICNGMHTMCTWQHSSYQPLCRKVSFSLPGMCGHCSAAWGNVVAFADGLAPDKRSSVGQSATCMLSLLGMCHVHAVAFRCWMQVLRNAKEVLYGRLHT